MKESEEEVRKAVEEYLAKGGKITKVKQDASFTAIAQEMRQYTEQLKSKNTGTSDSDSFILKLQSDDEQNRR